MKKTRTSRDSKWKPEFRFIFLFWVDR